MTIKEFEKEMKIEKGSMEFMLSERTLSYSVIYNTCENLHAKLKTLKNGKCKKQLGYKICKLETSLVEKLDRSFETYKCICKNKYTGEYSTLISSEGETKKHFIHDLRANGYIVNSNKVKKSQVWNWIMENTNCESWFWSCLHTMKDIEEYQKDDSFLDRQLDKQLKKSSKKVNA